MRENLKKRKILLIMLIITAFYFLYILNKPLLDQNEKKEIKNLEKKSIIEYNRTFVIGK